MIFGYFWNDPYNHVKIGMKDGANNVRGGNMMMMMIMMMIVMVVRMIMRMMMMMISMAMIVMIKRG